MASDGAEGSASDGAEETQWEEGESSPADFIINHQTEQEENTIDDEMDEDIEPAVSKAIVAVTKETSAVIRATRSRGKN